MLLDVLFLMDVKNCSTIVALGAICEFAMPYILLSSLNAELVCSCNIGMYLLVVPMKI